MSKEFINEIGEYAKKYSNVFIPSVTVAQAILESNYGKSELATNAKNIFGIKASDNTWKGETYIKDAEEEVNGKLVNVGATKWRKYPNWEESTKDHDGFLTRTDWHKNHYKDAIIAKNYKEQAEALEGTYATDSSYAEKLIKIIEDNELYKLDKDGKKITKESGSMNKSLNGKIIYIDAGHGGADPGASANGLIEKHWNLEVSLKVSATLRELGAKVIETRTNDVTVSMTARTNKAMANRADILLSIHFNALAGSTGNGYEDFIHDTLSGAQDVKFQNAIHAQVVKMLPKYEMGNRGKKRANFHMLREPKGITAVLVEAGFCTNWHDAQQMKKQEFKEDFALAMVNGIVSYFGGQAVTKEDAKTPIATKPSKPVVTSGDNYAIKSGDTLGEIAKKFGVTVDNLVAWNNIENKNLIKVGQVLTVKNGTTSYTVKSGDNLHTIASKFGTTADSLATLNEIGNPNLIRVGQVLKINGTEVITAPSAKPTNTQVVYTIKSGDTLSEIAKKYGTTADTVARTNGISNPNLIRVGQKLTISTNVKASTSNTTPKPNPATPVTSFKVGDRVVIKSTAKNYSTGQLIPSSIKGKTYTVQQAVGGKVLLKEIVSWVNVGDVSKTSAPKPVVNRTFSVGNKVKIKKSATKYITGQQIPSSIKDRTYTIMQMKNGNKDALLKEIMSWVKVSDLE